MAYFFGSDIWDEMDRLQRQMTAINEGRAAASASKKARTSVVDWIPAVELVEARDEFQIFVDLPGVTKKDIAVDLREGVLTISGNRPELVPAAPAAQTTEAAPATEAAAPVERRVIRSELQTGNFSRSFTVPQGCDASHVSASFDNGILRVSIAKPKAVEPRKIDIN